MSSSLAVGSTPNSGVLSNNFGARASSSTQAATTVDQLFADERNALRTRLFSEPALAPFRHLPDGMLTFLCGEKARLSLTDDARRVWDGNNLVSGYTHDYHCKDDQYHPKHFTPFDIKGYWIPESEGQLFATQDAAKCPLTRNGPKGKEVLFLIHPKSEHLYGPLMQKHAGQKVSVPALALSSFRSLLVALPGGLPNYALVKVTLDEKIGGAQRLLSLKECAGSVGLTAVLQQKQSKIAFMKEDVSFVPNSDMLDAQHTHAVEKGAGMIHRVIPECLMSQDPHKYVIPLFALFGADNRPLLDLLIKQSKKSPTEFVREYFLRPLAAQLIDLIYFQHTSIEAHGQNLLLSIDTSQTDNLKISFIYRDMGGVNCDFNNKDQAALPKCVQKSEYYFDQHDHNTSEAMEHFTRRVLFNLTKQFFKSETYGNTDPEFAQWKSAMIRQGFGDNWSIAGDNPNAHKEDFTKETFYRYGYFEKMFGTELLKAMSQKGIFVELCDSKLTYDVFNDLLYQPGNPYNTCVDRVWFKDLILNTYRAYREMTS